MILTINVDYFSMMDTVCVSSDVWIGFLYLILMYVGLQIVKINV